MPRISARFCRASCAEYRFVNICLLSRMLQLYITKERHVKLCTNLQFRSVQGEVKQKRRAGVLARPFGEGLFLRSLHRHGVRLSGFFGYATPMPIGLAHPAAPESSIASLAVSHRLVVNRTEWRLRNCSRRCGCEPFSWLVTVGVFASRGSPHLGLIAIGLDNGFIQGLCRRGQLV